MSIEKLRIELSKLLIKFDIKYTFSADADPETVKVLITERNHNVTPISVFIVKEMGFIAYSTEHLCRLFDEDLEYALRRLTWLTEEKQYLRRLLREKLQKARANNELANFENEFFDWLCANIYDYGNFYHFKASIVEINRNDKWAKAQIMGKTIEFSLINNGNQIQLNIHSPEKIQIPILELKKRDAHIPPESVVKPIFDLVANGINKLPTHEQLITEPILNYRMRFDRGGKSGFRDAWGVVKVPAVYDLVTRYCPHTHLSMVRRGNKFGYIDLNGNEVIPLQFTRAKPFERGMAEVEIGNRHFTIDPMGNVIIPPDEQPTDGTYMPNRRASSSNLD